MTLASFRETLRAALPPDNISVYLKSLWYDAKGDWDSAHKLIQAIEDKKASLIHAYLHRKEGDISNAKYWYNKSATTMPHYSLDNEWEQIVTGLL